MSLVDMISNILTVPSWKPRFSETNLVKEFDGKSMLIGTHDLCPLPGWSSGTVKLKAVQILSELW